MPWLYNNMWWCDAMQCDAMWCDVMWCDIIVIIITDISGLLRYTSKIDINTRIIDLRRGFTYQQIGYNDDNVFGHYLIVITSTQPELKANLEMFYKRVNSSHLSWDQCVYHVRRGTKWFCSESPVTFVIGPTLWDRAALNHLCYLLFNPTFRHVVSCKLISSTDVTSIFWKLWKSRLCAKDEIMHMQQSIRSLKIVG